MSKRFTDTEKWGKAWFRKLKPKYKCAWIYLLDKCDHAGVWQEDFEAMSFNVGEEIGEQEIESVFHGRVVRVDSDKFMIESFVQFQYGELRDNNTVHQSVIRALTKIGVEIDIKKGYSSNPNAIAKRLSEKRKREVLAGEFYKCSYCGIHGDDKTLVVDHILPRNKGGENNEENLTAACVSCNSRKSDLDPFVFIERNNLTQTLSESLNDKLRILKGVDKELNTPKDKDKEKDKDKAKEKEKESGTFLKPERLVELFNSKLAGVGNIKASPNYFLPSGLIDDFKIITGFPEFQKLETWENYFNMVATSDYFTKTWTPSLAWLLVPENAYKVLGGQYQNAEVKEKPAQKIPEHLEANASNWAIHAYRELTTDDEWYGDTEFDFSILEASGDLSVIRNSEPKERAEMLQKLKAAYFKISAKESTNSVAS